MSPKAVTKEEMKCHYNSLKDFKDKSDGYYFQRRTRCLSAFLDNVSASACILNLGCGDGKFSNFLKQSGFSNIVDADISISLLSSDKCPKKILGDAETLSFRENMFDIVIMTDVIEHIENRKKTFSELFRVLKKDGMVFISYPNPLWVPVFNFLGIVGIKVDAKDGKVPPEIFEAEIHDSFKVCSFETIMLASKLPGRMLRFLENIEKKCSPEFMNRFGFTHVYIIKKR